MGIGSKGNVLSYRKKNMAVTPTSPTPTMVEPLIVVDKLRIIYEQ